MSNNVFTLDALREEVDKEYAPFKIRVADGTEVTLRSLLRLSKKDRDSVLDLIKKISSEDEERDGLEEVARVSEVTSKIIQLIADKDGGKKLLADLDGDLQVAIKIIEAWITETQLGEAQNSPDSSTDTASS
jgi:hypothetical protein